MHVNFCEWETIILIKVNNSPSVFENLLFAQEFNNNNNFLTNDMNIVDASDEIGRIISSTDNGMEGCLMFITSKL